MFVGALGYVLRKTLENMPRAAAPDGWQEGDQLVPLWCEPKISKTDIEVADCHVVHTGRVGTLWKFGPGCCCGPSRNDLDHRLRVKQFQGCLEEVEGWT